MPVTIQHLPKNKDQWQTRVQELIRELRRPDLTPCRGFLYRQDADGNLSACIEGVINEMAIRNGIPAMWAEMEIEGEDGEAITIWEIEPPTKNGAETNETSNRALKEALLYHGFNMQDGHLAIDLLDCDPTFIRTVINVQHGTAFGTDYGARLNDKLVESATNPLTVTADILEHLLERLDRSIWHGQINRWAT